jgi:hypothetical protein
MKRRRRPSTSTLGAVNELRISANLLSLGWQVFRNVSPNGPHDLLAVRGRTVLRVQCKSNLNGQHKWLRAGGNDLLVIVGEDGELRYRAASRRVARMFPACGLVRKPKRRQPQR